MQKENFDFLQDHSARFLEMALSFDRRKRMAQPDGVGKKTGACGDTVEIFLAVSNDRIRQALFEIDGCQNTNAAANAVCHLVEGKRIESAWQITPEMVADFLETLPENHFHCAELAVGALYMALTDCHRTRQESWKKLYR
jgi:nitrogen fixation NifU-like protein